jgi:hypothetical protein
MKARALAVGTPDGGKGERWCASRILEDARGYERGVEPWFGALLLGAGGWHLGGGVGVGGSLVAGAAEHLLLDIGNTSVQLGVLHAA